MRGLLLLRALGVARAPGAAPCSCRPAPRGRPAFPPGLRTLRAAAGAGTSGHPPDAGVAAARKVASARPPRFFVPAPLPPAAGLPASLPAEEATHASRVLRLKPGDAVELCDGQGSLQAATIATVSSGRGGGAVTVTAAGPPAAAAPALGPRWVLAAACGSLKGGRADWLIEKAAEMGAAAVVPLLTERSAEAAGQRPERWERLALAASKQCLRPYALAVAAPLPLARLLPELISAPMALLAAAGAPPLAQVLLPRRQLQGQAAGPPAGAPPASPAWAAGVRLPPGTGGVCYLIVGPEGDFTAAEGDALAAAGCLPVGLGPLRLRVETAGIALLAAAMLFGSADGSE